ncbi:SAM-dependent methyltransferase [Acinetobacter thermotolerans]
MTKVVYKHDYFAELYRENNGDPWRYEQRWYEQRKRDITLAVLPQPSFSTGIEIGCSNGVLSSELAKRCEYLICMDANPTAIQLANQRLTHDHVKVVQGIVPLDLPEQQFDLIVASEVLYYLEEQILQQLIYWVNTHLSPNGCIVACNEELEIANCLQALERARQYFYQHQSQTKNIDIEILVVLDSCTDRTLEIIKTYNVSMISCTYRCVGQTRDLGIRYLIEQGCDWICCTDADSRVSLDWFTSMLKHQPTHVICGVVEIAEWQHLSDATRQDYLSHYQDRTGHRHIHGANLCFRASSYLALGGFKAMPCHEDVDLVKRAEKIGLHISWSNQLRVITSSRLNSRVDEGFSRFLRVIEQENLHEYSSESALRKIV